MRRCLQAEHVCVCVCYLAVHRIHHSVLQEFHHDELLQELKVLLVGLVYDL